MKSNRKVEKKRPISEVGPKLRTGDSMGGKAVSEPVTPEVPAASTAIVASDSVIGATPTKEASNSPVEVKPKSLRERTKLAWKSVSDGLVTASQEALFAGLVKWGGILLAGLLVIVVGTNVPQEKGETKHRSVPCVVAEDVDGVYTVNELVPGWVRDVTGKNRSVVTNSSQGQMFIVWKTPSLIDRFDAWFNGKACPIDVGTLYCAETGHKEANLLLYPAPVESADRLGNRFVIRAVSCEGQELFTSVYKVRKASKITPEKIS
jgi:hypothetical protein